MIPNYSSVVIIELISFYFNLIFILQIGDRQLRGIPILVGIFGSLNDEGIISRSARAIANLGIDPRNVHLLHREGIADLLTKTLTEVNNAKTKQVIVRAIR